MKNLKNLEKIVIPTSPIAEFKILGLHGEKDLSLKFKKGVKIIVADNGSGKTTLLNAFYSVLEGNFSKLGWLDFSEIHLIFNSGTEIIFKKSECPHPLSWSKMENSFLDEIKRLLGDATFKELALVIEKSNDEDEFRENLSPALRRAILRLPYSIMGIYRQLRDIKLQYNSVPRLTVSLKKKWALIKSEFSLSVIYMPTYRRVEEDIRTLGLSNRIRPSASSEERHIYFGMADVRSTFDRVTSEIRVSTAETFRAVSSKVIDQLLEGGITSRQNLDLSRLQDQEAINLVLKRLGKDLPANRLAQLNNFIKNPADIDSDGKMMLYLLNNFFEIYENQIANDRKIKNFIEVANGYLVNKQLQYDEVNISIEVFSQITKRPIDVERASCKTA